MRERFDALRDTAFRLWGDAIPGTGGEQCKYLRLLAEAGHTAEQYEACYRAKKSDRWWADKPLTARKMLEMLPDWLSQHQHELQRYLALLLPTETANERTGTAARTERPQGEPVADDIPLGWHPDGSFVGIDRKRWWGKLADSIAAADAPHLAPEQLQRSRA